MIDTIVSLDQLCEIRWKLGKVVCTSGGYDPLHSGHISCFRESKKQGDTLIVIVNGDWFLRAKKVYEFMNLRERCEIISSIKYVDYVIPYEVEDDHTVIKALEEIVPDVFTKGGDRVDKSSIPEWITCEKLGIKLVTKVNPIEHRAVSSSDFLKRWLDVNGL